MASPTTHNLENVAAIYNVIDSRQSDPQNTVIEALRLLGYTEQARTTLIFPTRWSR